MFTMAVLQNRRHELFCQFIVEGYPAGSARRAAGYRDTPWTNANGRKLKGQPKIKERIAELEQLWAEKSTVQKEYVQAKLLEIAEGRAFSRTVKGPKGPIEECDRLGAFTALLRSLGVVDISVSATAEANLSLGARLDRALGRTGITEGLSPEDQRALAEALTEGLEQPVTIDGTPRPQADMTPSSTPTDERVSSAAERPEKTERPMRF